MDVDNSFTAKPKALAGVEAGFSAALRSGLGDTSRRLRLGGKRGRR
jgi:hypothetical protein